MEAMQGRGDGLRAAACDGYSAAAREPDSEHPFPVGRSFAENLGYPKQLLDALQRVASEAFTGVSTLSLSSDSNRERRFWTVGAEHGWTH